jgi:hypothetical protein
VEARITESNPSSGIKLTFRSDLLLMKVLLREVAIRERLLRFTVCCVARVTLFSQRLEPLIRVVEELYKSPNQVYEKGQLFKF